MANRRRLQDLGGELHVQIEYVEEGVVMGMPKVSKNVLHFIGGKCKPLVLNPTKMQDLGPSLGQ